MDLAAKFRWAALIVAIVTLVVGASIGVVRLTISTLTPKKTSQTNKTATVEKVFDIMAYDKPGVYIRLGVRGPVISDEKYRSYNIDISQKSRVMQSLETYQNNIAKELVYENNPAAFTNLLKSLRLQGFHLKDPAFLQPDDTGYCPKNARYYYEIYENNIQVFRAWGTSCSSEIGTSAATGEVKELFKKQIPEFTDIVDTTLKAY
jgi:hypothetical protein